MESSSGPITIVVMPSFRLVSCHQKDQLAQHQNYLAQLENDLAENSKHPPEKGSKSRIIQDYLEKETYLQFEVSLIHQAD